MTDHKFADEEIVELLRAYVERKCDKCNVRDLGICCDSYFITAISQGADLITRLKVEKKSFSEENKILRMYYGLKTDEQVKGIIPETLTMEGQIRAEAIKEFAERLKPKLSYYDEVYVDNLVKEMTEGGKHP